MLLQSSVLNTNISRAQYPPSDSSHLSGSTFTHDSISGVLSGMKRNGTPHETASGSSMSSATISLGSSDRISASFSGGGGGC
jgi:hypothetical protein